MRSAELQLDLDTSPALRQFYDFEWQLIGNLGVDLLVELLAPLIGLADGIVDLVAQLGRLWFAGLGLQEPLEPGSLGGEQRSRPGLVHPRLLGSGSRVHLG
jgi:hypothetical protein